MQQKRHWLKALLDPLRRNMRRYGGHLVHVGVILISIGIIGIERLQEQTQVTLALGESTTLGGYTFIYEGLESFDSPDGRNITQAVLAVQKDAKPVGALFPARDFYYAWQQTYTRPGLKSDIWRDYYAILIDWRPVTEDQATFKIFLNPLVNWLWIGAGVLSLGVFMALWPRQKDLKDRM
jgi:cytochrome c-type biogenesis protein CcmF